MEDQTVRSAQRIFQLMEILAKQGAMGVTELSAASGLNKATVYRQLATLAAMGYARQEESGKYGLTFKLLAVANQLLERCDMRSMVHPHLCRLAEQTGETVHLVQREGGHIIYIDKVEPTVNSIRMVSQIGMRQPLTCTAVGKALLAEFDNDEVQQIWAQQSIKPLTPHTLIHWPDFAAAIRRVRADGYATDDEENELGVRCVAVALPDYAGRCIHAVSVSAPVQRMPDSRVPRIAERLLAMKAELIRSWR